MNGGTWSTHSNRLDRESAVSNITSLPISSDNDDIETRDSQMVPPPTRYPYLSQTKQLEHLLGRESGSTMQQERIDACSDRRRSEGGYGRYSHITHGNADVHVKFSDACFK